MDQNNSYNEAYSFSNKLKIDILDVNKFIKMNECPQVTNAVLFQSNDEPMPDGLLSYELFGITAEERASIFGYIDLAESFITPYYYKIWLKLDKALRAAIYETERFSISNDGYLIKDPNGDTGIPFLYKNRKRLKFKQTKQDVLLNALLDGNKKDLLFQDKVIVIPPFYRDVDTRQSGRIGVGEVNKLYMTIINNVKALTETNSLGLDIVGPIRGKIQDTLVEIFNWFELGEAIPGGEHSGVGIFRKFGIVRRAISSKTTDNGARLVLSEPNIHVENRRDLMVDTDHAKVPLSACLVAAYPFIIYHLNATFNNMFSGERFFNANVNGVLKTVEVRNIQMEFSNDRFDSEINEYIHGYSNRIKPVIITTTDGSNATLRFKGYSISEEEYMNGKREDTSKLIERDLTWLDIFYRVAVDATHDKVALITRYPIDSYFNQVPLLIRVASTIETQPMVIGGKLYKWYPKITQSDIGSNTANKFIDTLSICNPFLKLMGADYDGDMVTLKILYTEEANEELKKQINSKSQFINMEGSNGRKPENESLQVMYNLTLVLPEDMNKMTTDIKMK